MSRRNPGTNVGSSQKHKKICHKSFHFHPKQHKKLGGTFWFCAASCYRGLMHIASSKSVIACLSPLSFAPLQSDRHLWIIFVCWLGSEIKPFGSQSLQSSGSYHHWSLRVSWLCSVICNGLPLQPCWADKMTTITFSRAVWHLLCAQPWIVRCIMLVVVDFVLSGTCWV